MLYWLYNEKSDKRVISAEIYLCRDNGSYSARFSSFAVKHQKRKVGNVFPVRLNITEYNFMIDRVFSSMDWKSLSSLIFRWINKPTYSIKNVSNTRTSCMRFDYTKQSRILGRFGVIVISNNLKQYIPEK